jgi:hypothetical protein
MLFVPNIANNSDDFIRVLSLSPDGNQDVQAAHQQRNRPVPGP